MVDRQLGASGIVASRLVLGTMNFGRTIPEDDSIAVLDAAIEQGITFLDTANTYGTAEHKGLTEEILGRWFAARPGVRDRIVLATKVFGPMHPDQVNSGGLSALNIRRAVDASLRRLGTDRIDIYQFHHVDRRVRWEEIWEAVDALLAQGKIVYTGSSNFAGWNIAEAQASRTAAGRPGLISEQSLYNLATREIEREVIPAAQRYGLGIIPWSPLHGGLLAGAPDSGSLRRLAGIAAEKREKTAGQLALFADFARQRGHGTAEIALSWLLHQPAVHGPIIGPRNVEQLRSAVAAEDVALDGADLATLDEIFPPAGTAPEYYSW